MRSWILGLFVLALYQGGTAAATTDSVVSGRAISNTYMDYVRIDCPKGEICMDAWFKWIIDVKKTLRGPPLNGRVTAVRMQHSTVIRSYEKRLRSFVLRPIEDPKRRTLLRSDYYLVSTSFVVAGAADLPPVQGYTTASAHGVGRIRIGLRVLSVTSMKCSHLDSISAGPVPVGFDPKALPQVPATLISPPRRPIKFEIWRITGCGRSASVVVRLWQTTVGKEEFYLSPLGSPGN